MAEQKTKPTSVSVDEWLASIEDPVRRADAKMLVAMLGKISGEKPVMWGVMVGFGQYHYKYESGTEGDRHRFHPGEVLGAQPGHVVIESAISTGTVASPFSSVRTSGM